MNSVFVEDFGPAQIASGGTIRVRVTYSADVDGFIVVNEGANFDAMPGKIAITAGEDLGMDFDLKIERQPAMHRRECSVTFTLGPAAYTIMVDVV